MKRQIIIEPYKNGFSGPEFPIGEGPFIRIPAISFRSILNNSNSWPYLWISTDKNYNFCRMEDLDPSTHTLGQILNTFSYYNCSHPTGRRVAYWVDLGDIKLSDFNEMKTEYFSPPPVEYTTLVERYAMWLQ